MSKARVGNYVFRRPFDGREDGLVVGPGEQGEDKVVKYEIEDALDPVGDLN